MFYLLRHNITGHACPTNIHLVLSIDCGLADYMTMSFCTCACPMFECVRTNLECLCCYFV